MGRTQAPLAELPLQGNGQIVMKDATSGTVIYKTSFSSLFQEWLETDEAQHTTKGFENTFLVPYPLKPVEIEITLLDSRRNVRTSMKHTVNPDDILIQQKGTEHITPHKYLQKKANRKLVLTLPYWPKAIQPTKWIHFIKMPK